MYKAKFEEAENFYKKKGYIVLNPAVLPSGMQPADYMRICFAMIDTADAVSFLPFSDEEIYMGLTAVFTVAAAVWAWWKNNSFTENAIAADEYKDMLNNGGEGKENA